MKVLLIDDEIQLLAAIKTELEFANISTYVATNAADAMAILGKHRVDVCITDINMPGTDGLKLIQQIHAAKPNVRIFIMTGHLGMAAAVRSHKGVEGVFSKPLKPEELLSKLLVTKEEA